VVGMNATENNTANIPPVQLTENSQFQFKCHPGVSCFTQCCRGIDIMLTPYDVIRIKNRMGIPSEDFLALYTKPHLLETTDLPVITIKMMDDEQHSCPFVREDGCIVYEDRPTTCRYYPLGVATLSYKEQQKDGFYIFINEPHCRGFEEKDQWTVAEWRKNQGVDIHDEINELWTDLIVRKKSIPSNVRLTEKTKKMFFTASYDMDGFRRFIFESSFLTLYDIDKKTLKEIQSDEIALLRFGFKWLKWLMFKEGDFQLIESSLSERQEKIRARQTDVS
jgi:uncharacterized protein